MSRVYISQALCPKRHCIFALGAEADDFADLAEEEAFQVGGNEALRLVLDAAIAERAINPWCHICRCPREEWIFETARTRFRTIDEARPELSRLAAEQIVTRAHFEQLRRKAAGN